VAGKSLSKKQEITVLQYNRETESTVLSASSQSGNFRCMARCVQGYNSADSGIDKWLALEMSRCGRKGRRHAKLGQ
jgi:hypothetical protein